MNDDWPHNFVPKNLAKTFADSPGSDHMHDSWRDSSFYAGKLKKKLQSFALDLPKITTIWDLYNFKISMIEKLKNHENFSNIKVIWATPKYFFLNL